MKYFTGLSSVVPPASTAPHVPTAPVASVTWHLITGTDVESPLILGFALLMKYK